MRGATECAKRFKLLISQLRSSLGKVSPPATSDPISQMLLGILSRDVPESKAAEGLDRLRGMVVDYNELRVIPPFEIQEVLGDIPDARLKAEDISRSLNSIFALEHDVSLDRAAEMNKRDLAEYLDKVDGLEPYSRARIRLFGMQKHAIPLDEAMWAYARQEEIVNPKCGLDEAQQFLERQVKDGDGPEVFALLRAQGWSDFGSAVKKREVEPIRSTPPDRTARNMLQMVAGGPTVVAEVEEPPEPEEVAAETRKAAGAKKAATRDGSRAKKSTKKSADASASKSRKKSKPPAAKKSTVRKAKTAGATKKKPAQKATKRKAGTKRATTSRSKASKVAKTRKRKTTRKKARSA